MEENKTPSPPPAGGSSPIPAPEQVRRGAGKGEEKSEGEKNGGLWEALGLAWEMGYTIAVPLVGFALGGRLLDKYLGTKPWMLLTGIIISIPLSTIVIYWKISKIIGRK